MNPADCPHQHATFRCKRPEGPKGIPIPRLQPRRREGRLQARPGVLQDQGGEGEGAGVPALQFLAVPGPMG